jgi:hypothetical protein
MHFLMYTISYVACILSVLKSVAASNVIDLTPANFDDIVGSGKPALVQLVVTNLTSRLNSLLHGKLSRFRIANRVGVAIGTFL